MISVMTTRVIAVRPPPPMPCITLPERRVAMVWAVAATTEPMANRAIEGIYNSRRPNVCERLAMTSCETVLGRTYAVPIQKD